MTVITNMPLFRALVIRSAIDLYLKTGIKANRNYTPKNMLRAAGEITGTTFKRGQLKKASAELGIWLEIKRMQGETLQDRRAP